MSSAAPIAAYPRTCVMVRRIIAWLRVLHPFPSILVSIVTGALAWFAVGGWPGTARVGGLVVTMLCIQCSIGALNDWADRDLDAVSKPTKPIAAGFVPARGALAVGVAFGVAAAVFALTGGATAWSVAMAGYAVGLAYDLGLKRSPWSALTYALALPLVPVWVWSALERQGSAVWMTLPVGALVGVGLQLANALTDAESDTAAGVRGSLQSLGLARGRLVAWASPLAGAVLALAIAPAVGVRWTPFLPLWSVSVTLMLAAAGMYLWLPLDRAARPAWTALAVAAAVLTTAWFSSLPR